MVLKQMFCRNYLNNIYKNDIFWQDTLKSKLIENEILKIQSIANNVVNELDENSYLNKYISIFKLISNAIPTRSDFIFSKTS